MYDKEQIYDEQISPLMTKIIEICQANDMQMLASFFLKEKDEADDDMFCTTCLVTEDNRSDKLSDACNVLMNGYEVRKPFSLAMAITRRGEE